MQNAKKANRLIHSGSPYLKQHAYNPVDWYAWGEEALERAKKEDKPLLISIGYSACHWCHVMEHECFEDEATAALMNEYFVSIKVDREERPDIDQLYMLAVQLMSNKGGWPLNVFALPDGRPIYGGTYFPKGNWQKVLEQIHKLYTEERKEVEEYAENLKNGIRQSELYKQKPSDDEVTEADLHATVERWMQISDHEEGGPNRAPKFPLPNNYQFLLRYAHLYNKSEVMKYVNLTLEKMAYGGIYDQIGGGFARYSTDGYWKVPHFEKMLYDNAQLMSLYAEAWHLHKNEDYKQVCEQTFEFLKRELMSPEGYFFSALDADSEGEEGKFYVWKKDEIKSILTNEEYSLAEFYFNINKNGYWEDDNYILLRILNNDEIAIKAGITKSELKNQIKIIENKLLSARSKRIRPGLDDKMLVSWNAMMIRGLADAARIFEHEEMYACARKCIQFILRECRDEHGRLYHTWKDGKASIPAFLEDYAFLIDALLGLYAYSYDEEYLLTARELLFNALGDFGKTETGFMYFTSEHTAEWVSRQIETSDNVQPASNSVMAKNLHVLGQFFGKPEWIQQAEKMLKCLRKDMIEYGAGYSNWGMLALEKIANPMELVISGKGAKQEAVRLRKSYQPAVLMAAVEDRSGIALFEGRAPGEDVQYYICRGSSCDAPVKTFDWK
jgi:uncharacterized protein YyaL (SSP411 family)